MAPAHVAGSLPQRWVACRSPHCLPPPYFPSHPQSAAGALRSPFLCPPSLGLGSRASWPFSEAIKAPILQTQLCQPSAPCPSPVSAPLPRPHGTGSSCRPYTRWVDDGPCVLGQVLQGYSPPPHVREEERKLKAGMSRGGALIKLLFKAPKAISS